MPRKVEQEFVSANSLVATINHNGDRGGDAGHGGYVHLKFEDGGCTCMEVNGERQDKVELTFRGSTERDTLLSALKMFVQELENHPNTEDFKE